jgi:hypothetical protein
MKTPSSVFLLFNLRIKVLFAVEEYNKQGKPHLFFKQVFGGYSNFYPSALAKEYFLDLMAVNFMQPVWCTEKLHC